LRSKRIGELDLSGSRDVIGHVTWPLDSL